MNLRDAAVQVHVALACGVLLSGLAAGLVRVSRWRRQHAVWGRVCLAGVVASSVLALGLAADSHNRFGLLFALQPLVLGLSGVAQWWRARWLRLATGAMGLLVAAGVLRGFWRFLATRDVVDVAAFAAVALTVALLALGDLRPRRQPLALAHARRMLAVGWLYLAELLIFVWDPHPSLIAWAGAALPLTGVAWVLRRRAGT
ncbi:hypothetical protein [Ideonella sp. B508-1]|uniref:hypothetical protein n=1 Tax=Ideonella sp. B508-1 TaxID=137716 RepID=UPI00034D409E|nr:hypothetical protein [Ideonella sp. B508-1]